MNRKRRLTALWLVAVSAAIALATVATSRLVRAQAQEPIRLASLAQGEPIRLASLAQGEPIRLASLAQGEPIRLASLGGPIRLASLAQGEPDPNDVAAGMRIFRQKADCQACHGWAGDGRKMDSQMPDGANLRITKLDRDKVIVAIKCGIPGKSMPAFDRLAYSDGRCYNLKEADLQRMNTTLPDPPATLQPREIEQVADFLFAKVVGKGPMDRAKCIEYWGSDVDTCKEFK